GSFEDGPELSKSVQYNDTMLTPQECRIVLAFIAEQTNLEGGELRKAMQRVIVGIMIDAGYRPINVSRLVWHVTLKRDGQLWAVVNPSKTAKGEGQHVQLSLDTSRAIDRYLAL